MESKWSKFFDIKCPCYRKYYTYIIVYQYTKTYMHINLTSNDLKISEFEIPSM